MYPNFQPCILYNNLYATTLLYQQIQNTIFKEAYILNLHHLFFLDFRKILADSRRLDREDTSTTDYRKICLFLALIVNRYLPLDILKAVLQFGISSDYSDRVAGNLIAREVKNKTLTSKPNAYCVKYSLYSITNTGFEKLCSLLESHFPHCSLKITHEQLRSLFNLHQKDSLNKHSISESIAYVSLLLSSYDLILSSGLEKEVMFNTYNGERTTINERKGENLVSDIYFTYDPGSRRQVFIEVDMNTERLSGMTGIRGKSIAYASLANRISCISNHTGLQLIFTIHNDEVELPPLKKNGYTHEETRLLRGPIFHYIYEATLVYAFVSDLIPNRCLTVSDLINWLKSKNNLFVWPKNSTHSNLITVLEAVSRNISPYEDYPASSIRTGIEEAHYTITSGKEEMFYEYYSTIYKRRRKSIFNMVCEEGWSNGLMGIEGMSASGIMLGMTLACCPGRFMDKHLPFVLPELYFNRQMSQLLFHLGLIDDCNSIVSPIYCLPLRGNSFVNNQGVRIDQYDTYMRCLFQVDQLTVCIENISDDIGGYLRAKEYLKLIPSFRPGTILILLVSDDGILADGSHVEESTLYFKENVKHVSGYASLDNKRTYIDYSPNNIHQIFQYYRTTYAELNPTERNKYFLPYMIDVTQDVIMLSYSEFQSALRCEVSPWLVLPSSEKIQRGLLPQGYIPVPPAPSQIDLNTNPPCNWSSILSNERAGS